jgi:hypothetical protein
MKKTLFIFSIFLFIACASDDDKAKIDGANQFVSGIEKFEKNKELADKGFDSFESGDLEGLFALVSDDLIWNPPHVDSLSKDDYVLGMKGWHSEFENFKFTPEQGGAIEVWGDGEQTRSFLYIDECIEATRRLMESDFLGPVNIGSEEMVTINQLVDTVAKVAGKDVRKIHIDGPLGVRGRNSNNDLIREKLEWDYSMTLEEGISKTYNWISEQIASKK